MVMMLLVVVVAMVFWELLGLTIGHSVKCNICETAAYIIVFVDQLTADMRLWPGQVAGLLDNLHQEQIAAWHRDAHSAGEVARRQRTPNCEN